MNARSRHRGEVNAPPHGLPGIFRPAGGQRRLPSVHRRGPAPVSVEIAYTPTNSSWLNRIEAQFTALRHFTLDGTDHTDHEKQGSMIRRYIIRRIRHADDQGLRKVVARANVA
ncbi:hypothetical protein OTB20_03365 [Streptomyces sp. H27-H1]|nr:hypothetical protein [Streptomyces sp. H27-H1]